MASNRALFGHRNRDRVGADDGAAGGRNHQHGGPILQRELRIGAGVEQHAHQLEVVALRRARQRRRAFSERRVAGRRVMTADDRAL